MNASRAVVLAGLVAAVVLAGCTDSTIDAPDAGSDGGDSFAVTVSADYNSGGGNAFLPRDIAVKVGDEVTWTMDNAEPHTVDFAEPGASERAGVSQTFSGNLDAGTSYSATFTQPGIYEYYCLYHSSMQDGKRVGMVGTVTVS